MSLSFLKRSDTQQRTKLPIKRYRILKILQEFSVDGEIASSPTKKKPEVEVKTRKSPISPTQEHFIRMFVEFCINEKSKGMKGGMLREKDFKDSQVLEIGAFLDTTLYFPYLLDIKGKKKVYQDRDD